MTRKTRMSKKTNKTVTRAMVVRAFTSPARSHRETMDIVSRYMGNSPVPPSWGIGGVRGTFGKAIARAWAKKIRHLRPAYCFDPKTKRAITPVVQSVYDLGASPEALSRARATTLEDAPQTPGVPFVLDEFHLLGI